MQAPAIDVTLDDGSVRPLRDLYAERPLALVFLRHLGCTFCREHVAMYRRNPDLNAVFVTLAAPPDLAAFRQRMDSPQRFISDPMAQLYRAFEMRRGNFGQMFNLRTIRRGASATLHGHGMGIPNSDPWRLGGTIVLDTDGNVVFEHRSEDASDNLAPEKVREILTRSG